MEKTSARPTTVAGVAAAALLFACAPAFVVCPRLGAPRNGSGLRGAVTPLAGATATARAALSPLPALSLLSVVAAGMWARRSAREGSRVAAKALVATDAAGRYRFVVGGGSASEGATQNSSGEVWPYEIGATFPLVDHNAGETRWDPAGLTEGENAKHFDNYRRAELKHGRVAMMASLGLVVQHYWKLPGYLMFDDSGYITFNGEQSGLRTLQDPASAQAFGLLVLIAGIFELRILKEVKGSSPGDFGDPLGWMEVSKFADEAKLKTAELEHGRLAMLGFIGVILAEYVTGLDPIQQWEQAPRGWGKLAMLTSLSTAQPQVFQG